MLHTEHLLPADFPLSEFWSPRSVRFGADEAETGPHSEDELESETRDELDAPPEAPPEDAPAMVRRKSTRSKPPKVRKPSPPASIVFAIL